MFITAFQYTTCISRTTAYGLVGVLAISRLLHCLLFPRPLSGLVCFAVNRVKLVMRIIAFAIDQCILYEQRSASQGDSSE